MGDRQDPADRTWAGVRYGPLMLGAIVVGALVLGLGSRILMRLVGALSSPEHAGEATAFGVVDRVTVEGVAGLVVFGGIVGATVGAVYLLARPALPGGWILRGCLLSLLLLPPLGILIVTSSRSDFDLVSPITILALFGGMIVLDGLGTAWAVERLGRDTLPASHPTRAGYVALGGLIAVGFGALGASVATVV